MHAKPQSGTERVEKEKERQTLATPSASLTPPAGEAA